MKKLSALFAFILLLCLPLHAYAQSNTNSQYWGVYEQPDMLMKLYVNEDETFKITDMENEVLTTGHCIYDNGQLTLVSEDEEYTHMKLDKNGNLYCAEIEATFQRMSQKTDSKKADSKSDTYKSASPTPEPYWSTFEQRDMGMILHIYNDRTFSITDFDGEILSSGYCQFDYGLTLNSDDSERTFIYMDENNNLYCREIEAVFTRTGKKPNKAPTPVMSDADKTKFQGTWQYANEENRLEIRENGEWTEYADESPINGGYLDYKDKHVFLVLHESDEYWKKIYFDENGNLIYAGSTLTRLDKSSKNNTGQTQNVTEKSFQGYWQYENGFMIFIDKFTWLAYDDEGKVILGGSVYYENNTAQLMNTDGASDSGTVFFDNKGNLTDGEITLTRLGKFPHKRNQKNKDISKIKGEWLYSSQGSLLYFDEAGNYFHKQDDISITGPYTFDGENIVMYSYEEEGSTEARFDKDSGHLYATGEAGDYYYRNEN